MGKKIIFFDVDGTLVDVRPAREFIPEPTIEAIRLAHERGHLIYLCTGRSKAEIYPHILDVGIDGVIGAGGGYVEIGDEMLYHKKFSKEAINHVVDFFEGNGFDYYVESNGGLFASDNLVKRLISIQYGDVENDLEAKQKLIDHPSHFITSLIEGEDLRRDDINKVCFIEKPGFGFDSIRNEFEQEFNVIHCTVPSFGDDSGELSIYGANKATAINALIEHLGIDRKDTYAYGDGLNDIEMLQCVNVGVAVGNAKDGLKAVADEVCEDIIDGGIYNSMKKHNLI